MTAFPSPTDYLQQSEMPEITATIRPKVVEYYWGYEVSASEHVVDMAVMMRALCGLLACGTLLASLGVWLMPSMAFIGSAFLGKATVSFILLAATVMLALAALRGTKVRVQIDTNNGELREVVDGPLNTVSVLARIGLDAVSSVEVVPSRIDPDFGQIHIHIKGVGAIAAGDGTLTYLCPLRNRMASDFGLEAIGTRRPTVAPAPITA